MVESLGNNFINIQHNIHGPKVPGKFGGYQPRSGTFLAGSCGGKLSQKGPWLGHEPQPNLTILTNVAKPQKSASGYATSSPSFAPAWALAGTWWDRCRCSSSYSRQSAPSDPRSHSSRSGRPEKPGSSTTYHTEGGERKGWREENTVMGAEIRQGWIKVPKEVNSRPSPNEKLLTSLFLLPSRGNYHHPHEAAAVTLVIYS